MSQQIYGAAWAFGAEPKHTLSVLVAPTKTDPRILDRERYRLIAKTSRWMIELGHRQKGRPLSRKQLLRLTRCKARRWHANYNRIIDNVVKQGTKAAFSPGKLHALSYKVFNFD